MKKEIWKAVDGYEGWYEVSNCGNVRSVDRMVTYSNGVKHLWKGKILKIRKNRYGYLFCRLCKNSKYKAITVHRLVAQAFLPNPDNLPEINHKDEDKTNNCVVNLEWCTRLYNMRFGTAIQRIVEKLSRPILKLDVNTEQIVAEYPSTMEAERQLNISNSNISMCCNGKRKTAGGYKWRYKKE